MNDGETILHTSEDGALHKIATCKQRLQVQMRQHYCRWATVKQALTVQIALSCQAILDNSRLENGAFA